MAENIPAWLGKALAGKNNEFLPSWLSQALESKVSELMVEELDENMPEEMETRAMNKSEGDFTARMMAEVRSHESPRHGYNDYFGRGFTRGPFAPPKDLTTMTVDEVSAWQVVSNPAGNDTSAAGAYQIINGTLVDLKEKMNLSGDELFDLALQDKMARFLMERRGLSKFLAGSMDGDTFAAGMAREWASLPVLKPDRRGSRDIEIGQSYYRGDGVNQAFSGAKAFDSYKNLYSNADTFSPAPLASAEPLPKPTIQLAQK